MKLADLSFDAYQRQVSNRGICIHTGPFIYSIKSKIPSVYESLWQLYRDYPCGDDKGFADFHIDIRRPYNLRRWYHPKVYFFFDDHSPFQPLPLNDAYPLLEWGMNWCVANFTHRYLMIHAAVCEKNGRAVIMPAPPGSGKSTLCAALSLRGWRLLSDELTLIDLKEKCVVPVPRPVSLKNESIDVIRQFEPSAFINRAFTNTNKGTVAHMRTSIDSIDRADEVATPAWVILPAYTPGSDCVLEANNRARSFMWLAENSFNYSVLGRDGYTGVGDLLEQCDCYQLTYSRLDEAIAELDHLAEQYA